MPDQHRVFTPWVILEENVPAVKVGARLLAGEARAKNGGWSAMHFK